MFSRNPHFLKIIKYIWLGGSPKYLVPRVRKFDVGANHVMRGDTDATAHRGMRPSKIFDETSNYVMKHQSILLNIKFI